MDCRMPGFPVHHQLLELAQTHIHWVGDNIQPSHPLSSPSLPVFDLSQHQGLFQWVSSSHQVAKYWSFSFRSVLLMNIQDLFPVGLTSLISLQSKGHSRLFSSCHWSFPESGSFPLSQFFASGGQSIGVSGSTSVLPMNIQGWFLLGLIAWISL